MSCSPTNDRRRDTRSWNTPWCFLFEHKLIIWYIARSEVTIATLLATWRSRFGFTGSCIVLLLLRIRMHYLLIYTGIAAKSSSYKSAEYLLLLFASLRETTSNEKPWTRLQSRYTRAWSSTLSIDLANRTKKCFSVSVFSTPWVLLFSNNRHCDSLDITFYI